MKQREMTYHVAFIEKVYRWKVLLGQVRPQKYSPFSVDIHFLLHTLGRQREAVRTKDGNELRRLFDKDSLSLAIFHTKRIIHVASLDGGCRQFCIFWENVFQLLVQMILKILCYSFCGQYLCFCYCHLLNYLEFNNYSNSLAQVNM